MLFGDGSPCFGSRCDPGPDPDGGTADGDVLPYCGDGKLNQASEACDDGNVDSADGCSSTCVVESGYVCSNPGEPCITTVICGDGKVAGDEQCDDKNTRSDDGCTAKCQLEDGWACPHPGIRCVAAECGDGKVVGLEECDDSGVATGDGCNATCQLEEGWKCDAPATPCTRTTCRDGVREGTEQCDDANFDLGDGCSPYCKVEPDCSAGACVSKCGDGIVLGAEACDDGNQRDGDGCSATCGVELGFRCTVPPLPADIQIPLVARDAKATKSATTVGGTPPDYDVPNHVDFEFLSGEPLVVEDGAGGNMRIARTGTGATATGRGRDLGMPGETFDVRRLDGTTLATISLAGKPVYAKTRAECDKTVFPSSGNAWDKCTKTTMDADSFHTWFVDHDVDNHAVTWPNFLSKGGTVLKSLTLRRGTFASSTAAFTAGGTGYTFDSRYMQIDGSTPPVITGTTPPLRVRGFFPADELGATAGTCQGNEQHNFSFTSEVRFWFEYDSSSTPSLNFSGDDDMWVYVNGHMALDIGGMHTRLEKSFTIDAVNAGAWGLSDGNVYEIAIFQAERNTCDSNYWLTLQGFNTSKSVCESVCGDGIVASDELCDDGDDNQSTSPPDYGKCGADCKIRGPNCGDGQVQAAHEQCDDGVNVSVYDFNGAGCAPGCIKPPRCGDGILQASNEECDDGVNDGSYGTCTSSCKLAARCGDGRVQTEGGEVCDDGPSGSNRCTPRCTHDGPR
jgi:fibro-slime domain-containing protein